ncbi:MAG: hypothetical protein ABIP42_04265 [Planctomycetota bacterium]
MAWIGGNGGFCARSVDGGASWTPLAPVGFAGTDCHGSSLQGCGDGFITGHYPTCGSWKRKPPTCGWSNYWQGKLSSNGLVPQLDAAGIPSVSQVSFTVRASQAVPNAVGLVIYSKTGSASLPFGGAILCVAPPVTRLPAQVFGSSGSASFVVGVSPAMSATSRCYQLRQHDSHHSDGTGMTLSNGLVVNFCR